jgi:hypothetical protein
MKITWDLHELTDFGDNLKSLGSAFSPYLQRATQDIAKALLKDIKIFTPKGKTGQLIRGWDGNSFLVKPLKNGYVVEIVNTTEYADAVNNGHYSHNQFNKGGQPYVVNNRTVPYDSQFGGDYPSDKTYVYGRFFVERGILLACNKQQIEQIIMKELQKWWDSI